MKAREVEQPASDAEELPGAAPADARPADDEQLADGHTDGDAAERRRPGTRWGILLSWPTS